MSEYVNSSLETLMFQILAPNDELEQVEPVHYSVDVEAILSGTRLSRKECLSRVPIGMDFRLLQILSGIRAMLLVLIDSCGPSGSPDSCAQDSDYILEMPAECVYGAIAKMVPWTELDFVPNCKYWKDWPLALFLEQDLPPLPSSWTYGPQDALFSSELGAYYRRLSRYPVNGPKANAFYRANTGIAQSKRGFAPIPRCYTYLSLQKHRQTLSTTRESRLDVESYRLFVKTFLSGYRAPKVFQTLPSLEISTRACVERSQADGGTRAYLLEMKSLGEIPNGRNQKEDLKFLKKQAKYQKLVDENGSVSYPGRESLATLYEFKSRRTFRDTLNQKYPDMEIVDFDRIYRRDHPTADRSDVIEAFSIFSNEREEKINHELEMHDMENDAIRSSIDSSRLLYMQSVAPSAKSNSVVSHAGSQNLTVNDWRDLASYYKTKDYFLLLPHGTRHEILDLYKEYDTKLQAKLRNDSDWGTYNLLLQAYNAKLEAIAFRKSFLSERLPASSLVELVDQYLTEPDPVRPTPPSFVPHPGLDPRGLPVCRAVAVIEPLKVRVITAMESVRNHIVTPLQSSLWKYLQNFPCFRLIGEQISEDVIADLHLRHLRMGGYHNDPWLSGDFSSATDEIDNLAGQIFMEELRDHLDPEDLFAYDVFVESIGNQVIIYPPDTMVPPVVQTSAQLMGEKLSFIILCLFNLFGYIVSHDRAADILRNQNMMKRLAVIINGDDILFRSNATQFARWWVETDKLGFRKSQGKNFYHHKFLTVNSVPITCEVLPHPSAYWSKFSWADIDETTLPYNTPLLSPKIEVLGFINVGLLTGQSKLTGRESVNNLPLSGWYDASVNKALHPYQAHKWFLKYHRHEIRRQTQFGSTTLNIFAHPLLGGLGFPIHPSVEPRFSPDQRRIAMALLLSSQGVYYGQESEFNLDSSLLYVKSISTGSSLVTTLNRHTTVCLFPSGSPLPRGYRPFVDESGISPLNLSQRSTTPREVRKLQKEFAPTPSCRLSSSRIRSLIKQFGDFTVPMLDLDLMMTFPFTFIKREKIISLKSLRRRTPESIDLLEQKISFDADLYFPANSFIDLPLTLEEFLPEEYTFPFSESEILGPDTPDAIAVPIIDDPEEWESFDPSLILSSPSRTTSSPLPSSPPLVSSGKERLSLRRHYQSQFSDITVEKKDRDAPWSRKGGRKW